MSIPRTQQTPAQEKRGPPYVGALLRLSWQVCRRRILQALAEHGFTDLNDAYLNILQYPAPDGVRPGDLAARAGMTKQAANYLLSQLEVLGYVERRCEPGGSRRSVYLAHRGRQAAEVVWATMQQVEAEWAELIGRKRFDQFLDVLRELSLRDETGKNQGPPREE